MIHTYVTGNYRPYHSVQHHAEGRTTKLINRRRVCFLTSNVEPRMQEVGREWRKWRVEEGCGGKTAYRHISTDRKTHTHTHAHIYTHVSIFMLLIASLQWRSTVLSWSETQHASLPTSTSPSTRSAVGILIFHAFKTTENTAGDQTAGRQAVRESVKKRDKYGTVKN